MLAKRFLDKGGPNAVLDLFKPYKGDMKVVFQSLKLLNILADKLPGRLEDMAMAGVPFKIIDAFNEQWDVKIIKPMLSLFTKMAELEPVKDILAAEFLPELIKIIEQYFKDKTIVKHGMHLLAVCSDNITSVETIQHEGIDPICDKVLKQFVSSEAILQHTLDLMENLIRMHNDAKPEFLSLKSDDKVEYIVNTTDAIL